MDNIQLYARALGCQGAWGANMDNIQLYARALGCQGAWGANMDNIQLYACSCHRQFVVIAAGTRGHNYILLSG